MAMNEEMLGQAKEQVEEFHSLIPLKHEMSKGESSRMSRSHVRALKFCKKVVYRI